MKKHLFIFLISLVMTGLLFMPACKSTEDWDPLGTWTVNLSLPEWGYTWTDTFTFTGNESGGSVSGLTCATYSDPQTGTWTKTADYTITLYFYFYFDNVDGYETVNMTGNSSEENPDSLSGTGTWDDEGNLTTIPPWTAARI